MEEWPKVPNQLYRTWMLMVTYKAAGLTREEIRILWEQAFREAEKVGDGYWREDEEAWRRVEKFSGARLSERMQLYFQNEWGIAKTIEPALNSFEDEEDIEETPVHEPSEAVAWMLKEFRPLIDKIPEEENERIDRTLKEMKPWLDKLARKAKRVIASRHN